ncbi:CRISPR-associated endonuclease Cas1 [Sphingomonas sp.]|jgi:CRISPR-associated endonuclease Cas1|uniref:CRISPR-associated endonuclease Cas1 n=1 Tax=Sphingomonas sp. TaxID=28214 RepID=UPI002D7FE697|nr:CRISPR-associated endonuclease Cas1 [Sphingomonas sp.]HEU0045468.1 CRISPR-associated endonuclease Cas1 [Sphingomonas sp.]
MTRLLDSEHVEYALRSEYWINETRRLDRPRAIRERRRAPIIINGDGAHLRIEKGTLHIRNGFTHYPQEQDTYRFFRGDLNLPSRIVAVDCSGGLSFDVLAWLAEQGVALICVDWKGAGVSVLACNGYAADREKVAWQEATRADEAARMRFSTDLIEQKLCRSIATLSRYLPQTPKRDAAIASAKENLQRLRNHPPADLAELRGIEGGAAAAYFAAWRGLPIHWSATAKYPVPDGWAVYRSRSSLANGLKSKTRNASHPLNALLNYAYGALQNRLQIQAVADGFDPTRSIMHHNRKDASAYILDIMEPERPKVDAAILAFVADHTFSGADFVIRDTGACRLSPQLARVIAALIR